MSFHPLPNGGGSTCHDRTTRNESCLGLSDAEQWIDMVFIGLMVVS